MLRFLAIVFIACMGFAGAGHAEVLFLNKDGWKATVGGSINAFGVYSTRGVIEDTPTNGLIELDAGSGYNNAGGQTINILNPRVGRATYTGYSPNNGDTFRVQNGLLPAVFGFNVEAPELENGLQMYARLGLYPHIQNYNREKNKLGENNIGSTLDLREVFFGVRTKEHGDFIVGKTLSIFLGKNILTDMTLFGVGATGAGNDLSGSTSLGRIGYGYVYPNFNVAFRYNSPEYRRTKVSIGVYDPSVIRGNYYSNSGVRLGPAGSGAPAPSTEATETPEPRLEMEISHRAEIGDVAVDGWINGMYQRAEVVSSQATCQVTVQTAINSYAADLDSQINRNLSNRGPIFNANVSQTRAFNQRGSDGSYQLSEYAKHLLSINGMSLEQAFDNAYSRGRNAGSVLRLASSDVAAYDVRDSSVSFRYQTDPRPGRPLTTERYEIEGDRFVPTTSGSGATNTQARQRLSEALRGVLRTNLTEVDPDDNVNERNISFVEALSQGSGCFKNPTVWGVGVGLQASYHGLTITGSGYWGRGLGTVLMLDTHSLDSYGNPIKNYGYIAQATYDFGQGTGIGMSLGATFASESNFDRFLVSNGILANQIRKNQLFDVMVWHNLNDNIRLVAEYGNTEVEWFNRATAETNLFSFGGFYFF